MGLLVSPLSIWTSSGPQARRVKLWSLGTGANSYHSCNCEKSGQGLGLSSVHPSLLLSQWSFETYGACTRHGTGCKVLPSGRSAAPIGSWISFTESKIRQELGSAAIIIPKKSGAPSPASNSIPRFMKQSKTKSTTTTMRSFPQLTARNHWR